LGKVYLTVALILIGIMIFPVIWQPKVNAAQITNRSLTLQAGASAGGSDPSGVVNHLFQFTVPTNTAIQTIEFHYCTVASGTCGTVTGLSTTSATIGGSTSAALSGFTLTNTTNADPYLTSASAYTPAANTALTVQLNTVTNPSTANYTFFVWITTWSGANKGGSTVDTGTVAASTANPIVLTGTMPESLIFCTGATVGETGGQPDCSTATSGNITFAQLFSPSATDTATSQMAASTNASHGYVITVNGVTLTNGSYTITAMSSATTSAIGTAQFGMNLEANTTPSVGTAITPASDGSNYFGYPQTGYSTANSYKFVSGDTVADSSNGASPQPTDAQIYTVSYIVNVPGKQPPGAYTTTLTYIATSTF
ncbi:MAG: hypothetical protein ACREF7_02790, partial [Candidatus Saccharimonadales bacterium]